VTNGHQLEAHLIDTKERWWAALSEDERAMMIECATSQPRALPDLAVSLVNGARSPAALAIYVPWEGQQEAWMLTEGARDFLQSQALDTES
jgi:hypothetical protein